MAKLLENIFRSVNIALVNELSILADRMDIDIWEVVDAASTKPFGFMRFEPGPGMGGHCLPVDPFYLTWRAREFDFATEFIELAGKVNQNMPYFCLEKIERALNDAAQAGPRRARCSCSASPTSRASGDIRESPALKIIELLQARGADVALPRPLRARAAGLGLRNVELAEALDGADVAVIVTAHPGVDHEAVARVGAATRGLPRRHAPPEGRRRRAALAGDPGRGRERRSRCPWPPIEGLWSPRPPAWIHARVTARGSDERPASVAKAASAPRRALLRASDAVGPSRITCGVCRPCGSTNSSRKAARRGELEPGCRAGCAAASAERGRRLRSGAVFGVAKLADDPRGVAGCDHAGRDRAGDDAAGADHGVPRRWSRP